MKIGYLLSNEMEADARLSDAILYAALRQHLGDRIEMFDSAYREPGPGPVWGNDRFRSRMSERTQLLRDAYPA